mmetsp:Transcript_7134/g.17081  ORF Transcript_7134/g.17081 Transcript_7134/m.17081 type:complete len:229 (-) Transcript_7134:384-1070(-)
MLGIGQFIDRGELVLGYSRPAGPALDQLHHTIIDPVPHFFAHNFLQQASLGRQILQCPLLFVFKMRYERCVQGRAGEFLHVTPASIFVDNLKLDLDGSQHLMPNEPPGILEGGVLQTEFIQLRLDPGMILELLLLQGRPEDMRHNRTVHNGIVHFGRFRRLLRLLSLLLLLVLLAFLLLIHDRFTNIAIDAFGVVNVLDHNLALPHAELAEAQFEQLEVVNFLVGVEI